MVYGRTHQHKSSLWVPRFYVVLTIFVLVILISLQHFGALKYLNNVLRGQVNDTIVQSNVGQDTRFPETAKDLRAYALELERELETLRHWELAAKSMSQKIAAYEHLLNLKASYPFEDLITAEITTETKGPFAFTYLVDAGTREGVALNSIVINDAGLVGRVIRVGNASARVLLIKDFNSRIPIYGDTSGTRGILYGNQANNGTLRDLPDEATFLTGENIFTSGAGGVFPRGILVGTVLNDNRTPAIRFTMVDANAGYVQILKPRQFASETTTPNATETLQSSTIEAQ